MLVAIRITVLRKVAEWKIASVTISTGIAVPKKRAASKRRVRYNLYDPDLIAIYLCCRL